MVEQKTKETEKLVEKETLGNLIFLQFVCCIATVGAFIFGVIFYLQSKDPYRVSESEQLLTMTYRCWVVSFVSSIALLLLPSLRSIVKASLIYAKNNEET